MPGTDRDVGGLVGVQLEHVVVAGDARGAADHDPVLGATRVRLQRQRRARLDLDPLHLEAFADVDRIVRSEEHTSELQSLMRISYAVFCLKKKTIDSCVI